MSNKEWIKAGCVLGGLIGVGLLVHWLLKEESEINDEQIMDAEPDTKPSQHRVNTPPEKHSDDQVEKPTTSSSTPNRAFDVPPEEAPKKEEPVAPPEKQPEVQVQEASTLPAPIADEFPLRLGSSGERVERLQVWLMRNYGVFGKINATYDAQTARLVSKYLKLNEVDKSTYQRYKMGKHVTEQVIIR